MNHRTIFLSITGLSFAGLLFLLIGHFSVAAIPVGCLFLGLFVRLVAKENHLVVFTFLFPMVAAFASFGNRGMPLNYLMLPLFVFAGVYLADAIVRRGDFGAFAYGMDWFFFLFVLLIFISFLFVSIRWSNLTLAGKVFLSDTQVAPGNIRLSFGIIFPVLYLFSFPLAYLYGLRVLAFKRKDLLIKAFLLGHLISIFVSYLQHFFELRWFLWNPYNGLSSDASAFGFLCAVSLLLSLYLYSVFRERITAGVFALVALLGMINSRTRIGWIVLIVVILFILSRLKGTNRWVYLALMLALFFNLVYLMYTPKISKTFGFFNEMKNSLESVQRAVLGGRVESVDVQNVSAGREQLWKYGWKIMGRYPLSGVGAGNFVFWVMYDRFGQSYKHDLPSNQYLSISSSLGLLGLMVFGVFLWRLGKGRRGIDRWVFFCMLVLLFFGNYFWIAESFLAFWLVVGLGHGVGKNQPKPGRRFWVVSAAILVIFIGANIFHFSQLHPKTWAARTGTPYDYGLWYLEKSGNEEPFYWTKKKAGVYLYLDEAGSSGDMKLVCGAPLGHMPDKKQRVGIFWRGELYKQVEFSENGSFHFDIVGEPKEEGFLELRVNPTYNLKNLGLGPEGRTLGVQFFPVKENIPGGTP